MSKIMLFDEKARHAILAGVEKLSAAVAITMGPRGRNVVIEKYDASPIIINDGVTIAKAISLKDPYENLGAQLVKDVAGKTNDIAGDGTTTATVLTHSILREGMKNVTSGASPVHIKRGIEKAVVVLKEELRRLSKPIQSKIEIAQVGAISANNDNEIGEIIADAMHKVGQRGVITIEESKTAETNVDITEGLQFDNGYISPYFITKPETGECIYENPYILLSLNRLDNLEAMVSILEFVHKKNDRPLLIIAPEISSEIIATLVINKLKNGLKVVAVKSPGFGDKRLELSQDLASLTGATILATELGNGIDKFSEECFGSAKKIVIERGYTTIIEGGGSKEEIAERIAVLQGQLESADSYEGTRLKERLSKLSGGIAILNVGAASEVEMKEKKARIEDALNATRAAVEEGIVPGGGVALIRARQALKAMKLEGDEQLGVDIMWRAVAAPMFQIAKNAGIDGSVAISETERREGAIGLNAATGNYEDLYEAGVIDPTKVTRTALENAASVASMMLTTECLVVNDPDDKDSANKDQILY